jgi:2-methylcitrate dehydratase PrpD
MSAFADEIRPIVDFAASTTLADVPVEVTELGRLLLLDTLGALIGGLRYPPLRSLARSIAEPEPSGAGGAPFARLVTLGAAATWLDADSGGSFHPQGHRLPPVPTAHPAPHSLPVLLHQAATQEIDDRRLLEVFVLANEIGMRCGTASSLRPGMHPHGIHGPAAAALAATLLRRGSTEELARAFLLSSSLPIAATLAVPMSGGTVRNLWTGLGAYYGACASQWAASGAVASEEMFPALFDSAVCTDLSVAELVRDLGIRWQILNSYIKPYACARWIHPALDAVVAATSGGGLSAPNVESIHVRTFAFAALLNAVDVRSDMHARFSLPYCIATLLMDDGLYAESFLPDRLERPEVAALASRVTVTEDAAYSAALPNERPTSVKLHTRDGQLLTADVRNARGDPSSPLSREEIERKFRRNVGSLVSREDIEAVIRGVLDEDRSNSKSLARMSTLLLHDLAL